jgi:hypothetical protein
MIEALSAIVSVLLGISIIFSLMKGGEMGCFHGGCLVLFLIVVLVIGFSVGLLTIIGEVF